MDSHENGPTAESVPLGSINMAAEDIVAEPEETTQTETENKNLIWKEIQNARVLFNFHDFFYALSMGLAPMLWDIGTDFNFADWLSERKDITTAGLSYMCICLPGFWLAFHSLGRLMPGGRLASALTYFLLGTSFTLLIWIGFMYLPTMLYYIAMVVAAFQLLIKVLALFVHGPAVKRLSGLMTLTESGWESSCQLLLLLHIWLGGGERFTGAIVSSVFMMGKVGAETFLASSSQENNVSEKPFLTRLSLVARMMPVFGLTALFRLGSGAIILSYHPYWRAPVYGIGLTWLYLIIVMGGGLLVLHLLKQYSPALGKLTVMEMGQGILGEGSSSSVWGSLGREGSRNIHLCFATLILLYNISFLIRVILSSSASADSVSLTLYGLGMATLDHELYLAFSSCIVCTGLLSYSLIMYQIYYF